MRLLLALIVLLAFFGFSATIIKNDAPGAATAANGGQTPASGGKLDAGGYIDGIWESRVLPYMKEKAVDVGELHKALAKDADAAGKQYGYRAVAEQNPYNFSIKGRVKILSANVKSKSGTVEADAQPYDGKADVVMQIGPVFKGTSIRDMLDFIPFDDFKNQVEFARLATQLNMHVRDMVMKPLGLPGDGGVGREFDMIGATTPSAGQDVFNVVPVVLNPVGG